MCLYESTSTVRQQECDARRTDGIHIAPAAANMRLLSQRAQPRVDVGSECWQLMLAVCLGCV